MTTTTKLEPPGEKEIELCERCKKNPIQREGWSYLCYFCDNWVEACSRLKALRRNLKETQETIKLLRKKEPELAELKWKRGK